MLINGTLYVVLKIPSASVINYIYDQHVPSVKYVLANDPQLYMCSLIVVNINQVFYATGIR